MNDDVDGFPSGPRIFAGDPLERGAMTSASKPGSDPTGKPEAADGSADGATAREQQIDNPAGPHAQKDLTDKSKTPGAGTLPEPKAGDVDPGAG